MKFKSLIVLIIVTLLPTTVLADAADVFRKTRRSVVKIQAGGGSGTGFILSSAGLIVTNAHVVATPAKYTVKVQINDDDGEPKHVVYKKVNSRYLVHPVYDLAFIVIDPTEHPNHPLLPIGLSKKGVIAGLTCYAVGHPNGGSKSITNGIVSAPRFTDRTMPNPHLMSTVTVHGGNSGGPLVDKDGDVIGVVAFFKLDYRGVGSSLCGSVPLFVWKDKWKEMVPWNKRKGSSKRAGSYEKMADQLMKKLEEAIKKAGGVPEEYKQYERRLAQLYQRALSESPGNTRVMLKMANLFYRTGRYEAAVPFLAKVIEADPWGSNKAYGLLGMCMASTKKIDKGTPLVIDEAIAKFPKDPLSWGSASKYYLAKKEYAKSVIHGKVAWQLVKDGGGEKGRYIQDIYFKAQGELEKAGEPEIEEWKINDAKKSIDKKTKVSEAEKKKGTKYIVKGVGKVLVSLRGEEPPKRSLEDMLRGMKGQPGAGTIIGPSGSISPTKPIKPVTPNTPKIKPVKPDNGLAPVTPKKQPDFVVSWINRQLSIAKAQKSAGKDALAAKTLKKIIRTYPDAAGANTARSLLQKWGA